MSASALKPVKPRKPRNGLHLLATVVTWVFWFAVAATGFRIIEALFGQGHSIGVGGPAYTTENICVGTAAPLLPHGGSVLSHWPGLAPGVRATWTAADVCTAHPTGGQALAFTLTLLPLELFRLGALYLAMRLARTAARHGLYTAQFARLVLILGWWLLAGSLVTTIAGAFARLNLLGQLTAWHLNWAHWPSSWGLGPVTWIGLGLIIFARIMRTSAGMHADLEGTV
jgi:hypothetical protein